MMTKRSTGSPNFLLIALIVLRFLEQEENNHKIQINKDFKGNAFIK